MAAEKGNQYAREWTLENALPRFEDALEYATNNDECLCFQDAIFQSGIPSRTFYHLADNHEVLQTIKQSIADRIISRINRKSLQNIYVAAPAIWRMKQLGEKDQQYLESNTTINDKRKSTDELFPETDEITK